MRQQTTETLDALDRAFLTLPPRLAVADSARDRVLDWARAAYESQPEPAENSVALAFAVEMLLALPAASSFDCMELRELVETITTRTGVPRPVLATLVLRGTLPGTGPTAPERERALERALALVPVVLSAPQSGAWPAGLGATAPGAAEPAAPGESSDARALYEAATQLLAGDGRPRGATERQVSASTAERRLTQLRFDLHDGPLQDVVLLGDDLGMFSNQLEQVLAEHPLRERIIGRLDDLQAMLVALNGDLRRIASLLGSPFMRSQSFAESLAQITNAFAQRTETIPNVELSGPVDRLSDTHCITLLALIREALNNIREHSCASHVSITVSSDVDGVRATVTDDGRGFDPEQELIRAARGGHLGLVGMHERVRILGGGTRIESRPGGPTVISVDLPHELSRA
jgi:signal transduction histidine kinase